MIQCNHCKESTREKGCTLHYTPSICLDAALVFDGCFQFPPEVLRSPSSLSPEFAGQHHLQAASDKVPPSAVVFSHRWPGVPFP